MSRENGAVWDPAQYGIFGGERARPFAELVARLGDAEPACPAAPCGTVFPFRRIFVIAARDTT